MAAGHAHLPHGLVRTSKHAARPCLPISNHPTHTLHRYNALGLDHCGACRDCLEPCNLPDTDGPRVWDYEEREDNMVIIGVDPNAPTLRPLEDSCKRQGLMDGRAGVEMHLVLAASAAKRGKAIMNEHCDVPGDELCQITNTTTDLSVPGLDIFPVDSLSEASSAIASILSTRRKPIDILHIDTEGFDFEVRKKVFVVERGKGR